MIRSANAIPWDTLLPELINQGAKHGPELFLLIKSLLRELRHRDTVQVGAVHSTGAHGDCCDDLCIRLSDQRDLLLQALLDNMHLLSLCSVKDEDG